MAFDPVALRRKLHAAPELSREEHATSTLVADLLEGWGYEVVRGVGGTGVVPQSATDRGRTVGLRADLDPCRHENTGSHDSGLPASCCLRPRRPHGDPAGRATELRRRESPDGRRYSDGEESVSVEMLPRLLDRFTSDAVFSMHNWPGSRRRSRFRRPTMASSTDHHHHPGAGGHGALPHEAATRSSGIIRVLALQTIVARNVDTMERPWSRVCRSMRTQPTSFPTLSKCSSRRALQRQRPRPHDRIAVLAERMRRVGAMRGNHPPGFPALSIQAGTAFAEVARAFGDAHVGCPPRMVAKISSCSRKARQHMFCGNGGANCTPGTISRCPHRPAGSYGWRWSGYLDYNTRGAE